MRLDRFLNNETKLGQKKIRLLLASGQIKVNDLTTTDGKQAIDQFTKVEFNNKLLQSRQAHYIMLYKPEACVSATKDRKHTTVIDHINEPYKNHLHIGGRLDFNTTGLLLLTNNGQWSRKITEPTEKKPKTYLVKTEQEITEQYCKLFDKGIYLAREKITTQSAQLEIIGKKVARITIYEGRYHQVKRMFGFFSNKVLSLHRESMGSIILDPSLKAGEYRPLTEREIDSV